MKRQGATLPERTTSLPRFNSKGSSFRTARQRAGAEFGRGRPSPCRTGVPAAGPWSRRRSCRLQLGWKCM